ncbi:MAG: aldo/keto reductase [Ignavibacteriota bacterium]|nr:aldo/keto reductase [Ignavibacteriales bacterium]MBL1122373.1 aldo/keto reductase [Ignavibacteriota bacterium]MCE7855007.1 aldo/keto reductase [Ignavibacteria bacterium CHB3]MEB2295180.1 aldo/keto reductase [Ignavibacteria bacterium]NUM61005.1 aldo/keto reductase [Ignavibacteriaceae bacterium]
MILNEKYTLSNGLEIPKIALGTWFIGDETVAQVVKDAIEIGYRHIDTAQAYGNERGIGEGLKACSIKREDLFITTKLAAEVKSYNDAVASIANSLKLLGLDYIDLMIIHSPKPWAHYEKENRHFDGNREAWRALEDAYKAGKIRSIGVSNFQIIDIENIVAGCKVKPMVNQILAHISNTPFELIDYCKQNNILVEAYSPIAHGELLKNEQVVKMAEKYGVSVPQLAIRYCLDLGLLPLPKTTNPKNMKNNADVDFEISANDLEILKNIEPIKNYGEASNFPVFWK